MCLIILCVVRTGYSTFTRKFYWHNVQYWITLDYSTLPGTYVTSTLNLLILLMFSMLLPYLSYLLSSLSLISFLFLPLTLILSYFLSLFYPSHVPLFFHFLSLTSLSPVTTFILSFFSAILLYPLYLLPFPSCYLSPILILCTCFHSLSFYLFLTPNFILSFSSVSNPILPHFHSIPSLPLLYTSIPPHFLFLPLSLVLTLISSPSLVPSLILSVFLPYPFYLPPFFLISSPSLVSTSIPPLFLPYPLYPSSCCPISSLFLPYS